MSKSLVIGRLGRDLLLIAALPEGSEVSPEALAERSVREARVEEAFVVPSSASFSASDLNWVNLDVSVAASASPARQGVGLNPHSPPETQAPQDLSTDAPTVDPRFERFESGAALGGQTNPIGQLPGAAKPEGEGSVAHASAESQGTSSVARTETLAVSVPTPPPSPTDTSPDPAKLLPQPEPAERDDGTAPNSPPSAARVKTSK